MSMTACSRMTDVVRRRTMLSRLRPKMMVDKMTGITLMTPNLARRLRPGLDALRKIFLPWRRVPILDSAPTRGHLRHE